MEQLSKIVQQRLQATAKAGVHPDPNLLSAFAENALSRKERSQVLDHIAHCAECREIVSVALPELQTAQVAIRPPRSGWLSWPVVRWGALAACVVVVGAAVTLRYRKAGPQTGEVGTFMSPARAPSAGSELRRAEEAPPPQISADKAVLRLEATPRLPAKEDKEVSAKLAKQRGRFQESDDRDAFRQVIGELAMTKPTPPAAQTPAVPPAAPPAKAAELEQRSDSAQKNEVQDALRASHETITVEGESAAVPSVAESVAGKAKDADGERKKLQAEAAFGRNQGVLAKRHLADTREYGTLAQAGGKPVPRWTLSADGTLQRSLDGGRTWETILVPGKGVFRAVAAVESEIWVGGSAGALYHSADAGAHWVQVTPAMDGKTLTADIIGVEFADSLQGKLTTADHETWVTADGGQTWRK